MSNFFETLKSDAAPPKKLFSGPISSEERKSPLSRTIETDSPSRPRRRGEETRGDITQRPIITGPPSSGGLLLEQPRGEISIGNNGPLLPESEPIGLGPSGSRDDSSFATGNLNFFSNPEIKLKMKKADGIPTMTDFQEVVAKPLADKWKEFGTAVGLSLGTLETIERKNSSTREVLNSHHCFMEVFKEWETNKGSIAVPFTWIGISNILKYPLKEDSIAETIDKTFINQERETSTDRSDGSGYSSLPSSLNQMPSSNNGLSPPNSLSSSRSTDSGSIHPPQSRPTISGNVLPSPDYPYQNPPPGSVSYTNQQSYIPVPLWTTGNPMSNPIVSNVGGLVSSSELGPAGSSFSFNQVVEGSGGQIPRGVNSFLPPSPSYYAPSPFMTFPSTLQSSSIPQSSGSFSSPFLPPPVSGSIAAPYYQPQYLQPHQPGGGMFQRPSPPLQHQYVSQPYSPQVHFTPPGTYSSQPTSITRHLPSENFMYAGHPLISSTVVEGDHSVGTFDVLQKPPEQSSESSYHSATESIRKYDDMSFTELLQKYMKELETRHDGKQQPSLPDKSLAEVQTTTKEIALKSEPDKEKENLMRKELDKAYERISSLEVRVQDLTMQSNIEIPDDQEVTYMHKEKLEQEFRRMREMKKQAEKQNMEAKQVSQRLVAENSKLKEELNLVKNDREFIIKELKTEKKKSKERTEHSREELSISTDELRDKIAQRYKAMVTLSIPKKEHLMKVSDLPPMTITPEEFLKIINTQKGSMSVGLVVIAGLPGSGKSTLLKSLLQNENPGKSLRVRGEETCLQVHELLVTKNPLTEETKWSPLPGLESAVYLLCVIVAQYCFRQKHLPQFPSLENIEREVRSLPSLQDKEIQQHFVRIYKAAKSLMEDKAKANTLSDLALFHPTLINLWDVGVNRSIYHFLAGEASQCKNMVMVLSLDLERDAFNLDTPPDLSGRKRYSQRTDDKFVMKMLPRLRYLLLFAGFKRWFNRSSVNSKAPEVIIVGLHTKEFASLDDGKKLQNAVDLVQRAVLAEADKMKISDAIVPKVSTFCTNAENHKEELGKLKATIEELVESNASRNIEFEAKHMFLRSLLYGEEKPMFVKRKDVYALGRKCGIYFHDEIDKFLELYRDSGSLMFYPKVMNRYLHDNVALDVVKPLCLLDRLYYLLIYTGTKAVGSLMKEDVEHYPYGMVSGKLASKLFKGEDVSSFLAHLENVGVCVDISLPGQQMYFFPSIRTSVDTSQPSKYSLFIRYDCEYLHNSCLALFVNFFKEFFKVPSEAMLSHTKEYNTVLFKIYEPPSSDVFVICHQKDHMVEVRIPDLKEQSKLGLCSKLVNLSHSVFQHLGEHLQFLTFNLCVQCPENESHFVPFYLRYHTKDIYCKHCKMLVSCVDNRICWLS